MDRRERFKAAVQHRAVDRPPFDLEGTPMSMIQSPELRRSLARQLGIRDEDPTEGILRAFDIDFRRVGSMPQPQSPLAKSISDRKYVDVWGVERTLVGADWQITASPLRGASVEDLERFPWPQAATIDRAVLAAMREDARRLYEETDYVIVGEHPVFGVMELGCWMCGFDEFLLKMAMEPKFVEAFCRRFYQYQQDVIELYYGALGPYLHVTTSGDDFGTQNGPFLSPAMFDELIAPWYDKRIALTRRATDAFFFHHSCGSVYKLLPRIIESGVEILNPIQPNAADMEPEKLKAAYGSRIAFWGGVDTQHILSAGTPQQVRTHVQTLLKVFGQEGGYIFAPAHNLQWDVPAENVIEMFRAAKEYFR